MSAAGAVELARAAAATVDAAAAGHVIVLGSLPPSGRDLDLLARPPERERLEQALVNAAMVRKGDSFALFGACSAYRVELFSAGERFAPAAGVQALFEQALPVDGFKWLVRPRPAHALIVLARLVVGEGGLSVKRRARLDRILDEDPHAWSGAQEAAGEWNAERELALLRRAAEGHSTSLRSRLHTRRWRPRRPRRGLLVALSGIDGAGKSSQARWLSDALAALGIEATVVWNDLLGNRALDLLAAGPKALLRLSGRAGEGMARYDEEPVAGAPDPAHDAAARLVAGAAKGTWATIVTLANALEQRAVAVRPLAKDEVVVFDRSPLDLAVRMQVLYRSKVERQRRLVSLLAPRPDLAFLLDIPAEVSLARKHDVWSPAQLAEQTGLYRQLAPRYGVRRLDGQLPPEQLAAEIARQAWLALR